MIVKDEEEKIFEAFYRGRNAARKQEEGSGYGLYIAQHIAINHLDTKITVKQNNVGKSEYIETIFSITIQA